MRCLQVVCSLERRAKHHFAAGWAWITCGAVLFISGYAGVFVPAPKREPTATAVLIQPNLDVGAANNWPGPEWDRHIAEFTQLAGEAMQDVHRRNPANRRAHGEIICPPYPTHPDLVVWPESPAPSIEGDRASSRPCDLLRATDAGAARGGRHRRRFLRTRRMPGTTTTPPLIVDAERQRSSGRYDKIHLVPFGEYIPFQNLLTLRTSSPAACRSFTRGSDRRVFLLDTQSGGRHRYGVFICYEAVFADEVRQFARNGAEVLVNISDDGWYGDTSAPWQHLNMARMRAIENRRWLLRDTNNGVTAAIDPYGRVRQSIPRHQIDALPAEFGFRDDITFYTAHGDVFAWLCAILSYRRCWAGVRSNAVCVAKIQIQSQVLRAKHVIERSRIRLRSRAQPSARPAGVSLTLPASAGNSPK